MRKIFSLLMMVAFSVAMFANSYWYRGGDNSWGATAMTVSTDGLYEYIQSSSDANQFKIAASEDGWDYNHSYVQAGFNSTDVTNIDANAPAVKAIRNGQLFIIKGEKTYNAQGSLVK